MIRVVVVYDVIDNKRRRKLSDLLEGYGKRVNRSVFECLISSQSKFNRLLLEIEKETHKKEDSVRIYHLCINCIEKSKEVCDKPQPFEQDGIFFF